jgi:hypothetical protein
MDLILYCQLLWLGGAPGSPPAMNVLIMIVLQMNVKEKLPRDTRQFTCSVD